VSDIAVLVRMSDAQTVPGRPAPEIGQHTREVLTEFGYDPTEIDSLYDQGAVR
jgi:crotonobetainyl-CoA:carnitine CoA-transferase CaiB-like acyl-CoA transferase